jgi:uncharacterized protein YjbI with pentapeptide repeats
MENLKILTAGDVKTVISAHLSWMRSPSRGQRGDLSFCQLSGFDLSGLILRGMKFAGARLSKVNLSGCDLGESDFFGANLDNVNLSKAKLKGASLRAVRLRGANLEGADLQDVDLREGILYRHEKGTRTGDMAADNAAEGEETNFFRADLTGAKLAGAKFRNAHMAGAILVDATLSRADFAGCDLTGADLSGADLTGADFRGAKLTGARLGGVQLNHTNFEGADLRGLTQEDQDTMRSWATGATLDPLPVRDRAGLEETLQAHERWLETDGGEGRRAVFEEANLAKTSFAGRTIRMAIFRRCNLVAANFTDARLFAVDFAGSDLRQAVFRRAQIFGVRFDGADMFNVEFADSVIGTLPLVGNPGGAMRTSFHGTAIASRDLVGAKTVEADFFDAAPADAPGRTVSGGRT